MITDNRSESSCQYTTVFSCTGVLAEAKTLNSNEKHTETADFFLLKYQCSKEEYIRIRGTNIVKEPYNICFVQCGSAKIVLSEKTTMIHDNLKYLVIIFGTSSTSFTFP